MYICIYIYIICIYIYVYIYIYIYIHIYIYTYICIHINMYTCMLMCVNMANTHEYIYIYIYNHCCLAKIQRLKTSASQRASLDVHLPRYPVYPWWLSFEAWSLGCWDHTVVQGTIEMKQQNHFGRLYSNQFHSVTVYQGLLQVSEWCEQANRHDILHGIGKELKHEHTFGHILPSWLGDCPLLCCQNAVSWWRSNCRLM